MSEAESYLRLLESDKILGFDIESNGLDWKECYVCGWGISDGRDSYYVPVRHSASNIGQVDEFETAIANAINKRTKPLVAHNAKFDMHFSRNHGVRIRNIIDTMVMAGILDENRHSYSLKSVCKSYEGIQQKEDADLHKHISSLFGGPPTGKSMANYHRLRGDDPIGVDYAKADNVAVKQLYDAQFKEIYTQQLDVVRQLECDLTYVLFKMERRGIKVDLDEAEKLRKKIEEETLEAYAKIPLKDDLTPINTRSGKDLFDYFSFCGIQDWPLTEKGNPSFNKAFLHSSSEGELILQARKLDDFTSKFLEPLKYFLHKGRIHTNFNQSIGEFGGVRFGRLSSSKPNMQQVPKRDKYLGRLFRRIFIADEDFVLVELDYNQAEPRLFSHYSQEPSLLEGYNSDPPVDMHSVAAELLGIERDPAKSLNLGMMYTMGYKKLALQLGIDIDSAKELLRAWHKAFPQVSAFTKQAEEVAQIRGYVRTILGRRARFDNPDFCYRAANRIVQGGAADILKWKLVAINRWIEANNYDDVVQLLLNIHDSILLQIHKDHLHLLPEVKRIMESVQASPFDLRVPFIAEHKAPAKDWSDATYGGA